MLEALAVPVALLVLMTGLMVPPEELVKLTEATLMVLLAVDKM